MLSRSTLAPLVLRRSAAGIAVAVQARFASTSPKSDVVVGCGSNVVDLFMRLRAIPKLGEKGYFASPTNIVEGLVVGGVTLNHLSWANLLGVPTAGMFLQGNDPSGIRIRADMEKMGISTEHVHVSDDYTTAESYILLQEDGERSIMMASGSTSQIDAETAREFFVEPVQAAKIFTTEISQVPMSGVIELLKAARDSGTISILDVDVQPSVAVEEAGLGSMAEIIECVNAADILKPAKHAAQELLGVLNPGLKVDELSPLDIAVELRAATGCKLVALTDGSNGSAMATADVSMMVLASVANLSVTDATGAGDAFLGGLVASVYHDGIPTTEDEIQRCAVLANVTGASCCQVLGGLPDDNSAEMVTGYIEGGAAAKYVANMAPSTADDAGDGGPMMMGFESSLSNDMAALTLVKESIDPSVAQSAIEAITACSGRVLTTGLGKSGAVARRMAISLASIGKPAHFVHAAEWGHGDLGVCSKDDLVIAFSHSGKTAECIAAFGHIAKRDTQIMSITSGAESPMARLSDTNIIYSIPAALEPVGGAPTASVVAQEAIVNAVMLELIYRTGFTAADFRFNHPGGALGGKV